MSAGQAFENVYDAAGARGKLVLVRVGIDNRTGQVIWGWPHVAMCIARLFACRFHERVLERWLGSLVPHLLGELATESNVVRYFGAIATAIDLWEPCFRVVQVSLCDTTGAQQTSTIARRMRLGQLAFKVTGEYMPRGHLGDFTVENLQNVYFIGTGTGVIERLYI